MADELYGRAIVRVEAETRRALQEIRQFSRRADSSLRGAERSVGRVTSAITTLRAAATNVTVRVDLDDQITSRATGLRASLASLSALGPLRIPATIDDDTATGAAAVRTAVRDLERLGPVTIAVTVDGGTQAVTAAQAIRSLSDDTDDARLALAVLASQTGLTGAALGDVRTAAADASGELRTLATRARAAARALDSLKENALQASMALRTLITTSSIANRHLNDLNDTTGRLRTNMTGLRATVRTAGNALRTVGDPANNAARAARDAGDSTIDFAGNLKILATAAIPAAAALAPIAPAALAAGVAIGVFGAALGPQIAALGEAADAEKKYQDAVKEHGRSSKQAIDAQVAYQRTIADMPPAARRAAASVSALKEEFKEWSNDLTKFTMEPVTKGVDLARTVFPKLTPLVRVTSQEFSHFLDVLAGASQSDGFGRFLGAFTDFTEQTLARATSGLVRFTQAADSGEVGSNVRAFMQYARENGPLLADTFQQIVQAGAGLAVGLSDVGVSALTVVNALARLVNAIPPSWVSVLVQAYAALRLVRLGIAGVTAVASAGAVTQLTAFVRAAQFGGVGSAIQGVAQRMTLLQKVGGSLGVLGVVAFAIDALAEKARGAPPDVDKLTSSLKTLAVTGQFTGELSKTFGSIDGLTAKFRQLKAETTGLDAAKPFLDLAPGGPIVEHLAGNVDDLVRGSKGLGAVKEDFAGLDKSLASLASGGHADIATEQFALFRKELIASGASTKEVNALFPQYKAAIAGVKAEQELAARGMGLFGEQAVATGEQLKMQKASADGLRQSLQALNDVNRQGLGGMIGFEAAIDAAAKAATENAGALDMTGGKLNLNSEKARAAATSLQDLAQKTDDAAASARESGSSWETVNGIYDRGRTALVKNAMQMGLNRKEAQALADQILKTPDKTARLKGDVEDLKAKVDQATKAVKTVPDSKRTEMKGKLDDLQAKLADAKKQIKSVPESKRSELKGTITDLEQKVAAAKRALASPKDRTVNVKGRSLVGTAVAAAKSALASVRDKTATVRGRDQASGVFGAVRRMLDNLNGKTATTYVRTRYSATYDSNAARPFRRDGGPAPGFAGGGMPGGMLRGPGTGTSDSIPMWWASDGEYVINAKSTAKYRKLIEAINSDTLGSGAGGAGGSAGRAAAGASTAGMEFGQGLVAGMRGELAAVAAQARALGDAAVGAIRQELQISSPSKKLAKIGKDTGAGFVKGLTGTKSQINSTAKSIASSITSAFKGTGSRTDDRLVAMIGSSNKKLQSLAGQRDSIAKKIGDAQKFATDTAARARSTGSLGSIVQSDFFAPSFVTGRLKSSLNSIKSFTSSVQKLQKRGLSKDLLRQVLEMGPEEGAAFAKSLAGADAATIKRFNSLQSQISGASTKLGKTGADMLYDSGKKAGSGFLTGLKAQQKSIEQLMLSIAKGMQKAIRRALGIRSPSTVFAAIGRNIGDGLVTGLQQSGPKVSAAVNRMAAAASGAAPKAAGARAKVQAARRPGSGFGAAVDELQRLVDTGRWRKSGSQLFEDISFQGMSKNFRAHQMKIADGFWAAVGEIRKAVRAGKKVFEDMTFKGMSGNVSRFHDVIAQVWKGNPYGRNFGDWGNFGAYGRYGKYAAGGPIKGPGTSTSDSVLIRASTDEFMMRAAAVNYYGLRTMTDLNAMRIPRQKVTAPVVSSMRTDSRTSAAPAGDLHVHVHNDGVIGSQLELDNWLTGSLDRLARTRRMPASLTGTR